MKRLLAALALAALLAACQNTPLGPTVSPDLPSPDVTPDLTSPDASPSDLFSPDASPTDLSPSPS